MLIRLPNQSNTRVPVQKKVLKSRKKDYHHENYSNVAKPIYEFDNSPDQKKYRRYVAQQLLAIDLPYPNMNNIQEYDEFEDAPYLSKMNEVGPSKENSSSSKRQSTSKNHRDVEM